MRVVVTVGTDEHRFDRLVRAARVLVAAGHSVWIQAGSSVEPVPGAEVHSLVSLEALQQEVRGADVVITHGGPGSIWLALECGQVPVVVPRDPRLGEHVDDHQLRFAHHLRGRVDVVTDVAELLTAVTSHTERTSKLRPPAVGPQRRRAYALALGEVVQQLVAPESCHPTDGRATVAANRESQKS